MFTVCEEVISKKTVIIPTELSYFDIYSSSINLVLGINNLLTNICWQKKSLKNVYPSQPSPQLSPQPSLQPSLHPNLYSIAFRWAVVLAFKQAIKRVFNLALNLAFILSLHPRIQLSLHPCLQTSLQPSLHPSLQPRN